MIFFPNNLGTKNLGPIVLLWIAVCLFLGACPGFAADKEHTEKPKKKTSASSKKSDKSEAAPAEAPRFDSRIFEGANNQLGEIDAVLLVDTSRSMLRNDPQKLRMQAAKIFVRFLGNGDRIAIFKFDRDTAPVLSFTEAGPQNGATIDKAIDELPADGGFTDLEAPLSTALGYFAQSGRKDAKKAVLLISDGMMDPPPSKGTPEDLTKKALEEDLEGFKEQGIKLYTVSISEEADRELLTKFAQTTGGVHLYAQDPGSVHRFLSNLFLTLKRPQVIPLEGEGFDVDASAEEVTFYIERTGGDRGTPVDANIVVVDPKGGEYSSSTIPPNMKWFHGEQVDVITVYKPLVGKWIVKGIKPGSNDFATLFSDLRLDVHWPDTNIRLGDSVSIFARLVDGRNEVKGGAMKDLTFFTFKVFNSKTGDLFVSGELNDDGKDGDAVAGDGVYSKTLKLDVEGDYQTFVAASSATFTRQQRIAFSVSQALVDLVKIPPDEFSKKNERIEAHLSSSTKSLKGLKLQLLFRKVGSDDNRVLTLENSTDDSLVYEIPTSKLPNGEVEMSVRLTGKGSKDKTVTANSQTVIFNVVDGTEATGGETYIEIDENATSIHLIGIAAILLMGACFGGIYYRIGAQLKVAAKKVSPRAPYEASPDLLQRIAVINSRKSEKTRDLSEAELVMFVGAASGGDPAPVADVGAAVAEAAPLAEEVPPDEEAPL